MKTSAYSNILGNLLPLSEAELEPVRQSGSGPDKTGRKVHPAGRNRIFARFFVRFLPDFCQCDVKNEPDGIYRIFSIFLPDFCRINLKNDPAGFLPDWRQK
jgi:hypothetical protein